MKCFFFILGVFGTTTFAATASNTTATTPATTTASSGSLFSSTVPFGNSISTPAANVFGNAMSQQPSFGATKSAVKEEAEKKDSGVNFLPTDNSMSFSTLAAQTSPAQQPAFKSGNVGNSHLVYLYTANLIHFGVRAKKTKLRMLWF